jgi:DNA-binding XRE family transcriptional regulator
MEVKITVPARIAKRFPEAAQERQRQLSNRIAVVLRATRMETGVNQETVAEKIGWTRNIVANLESGRRDVTLVDLMLFAEALGMEPVKLIQRILQW